MLVDDFGFVGVEEDVFVGWVGVGWFEQCWCEQGQVLVVWVGCWVGVEC